MPGEFNDNPVVVDSNGLGYIEVKGLEHGVTWIRVCNFTAVTGGNIRPFPKHLSGLSSPSSTHHRWDVGYDACLGHERPT
jgi:hypothetical protein